jgi:hypothetical protein
MFFVQFPHPGKEHSAPADVMPWNTSDHGRKFLLSPGSFVDHADQVQDDDLAFWGEWEPASRVVARWSTDGRLPRALHRPFWSRPIGSGWRQNTDPWIFGDQMIYSNCKQTLRPDHRPTALQWLTRGSVICFGSAIGGKFCVDTVFVIASAQGWSPVGPPSAAQVGQAFLACTAEALASGNDDFAHAKLTLYKGATFDDPVNGMYSFVPALPAGESYPRFARPPVQLPGLINPASTQSAFGASRPLPAAALQDAWHSLKQQVFLAGLVLAVRLKTPPHHGSGTDVPPTTRNRC